MKASTIKALILATLIGFTLGISGCASTPEEAPTQKQSERSTAPGGVMAPEPANESDDMERLD